MDLLWKYYEKNNKYLSAALILSKLAERTRSVWIVLLAVMYTIVKWSNFECFLINSTDITLQNRVEYLSRAIISAKSASFPGASGSNGDFLHELEEKLEVLKD